MDPIHGEGGRIVASLPPMEVIYTTFSSTDQPQLEKAINHWLHKQQSRVDRATRPFQVVMKTTTIQRVDDDMSGEKPLPVIFYFIEFMHT
jgi:hypothetical protein